MQPDEDINGAVNRTARFLGRPAGLGMLVFLAMACAPRSSSPVRLNEVMPSNGNGCRDEIGERDDWVEVYNTGDLAVDLSGYALTDDTASPRRSVLPEGLTLEARSALLLWADGTPSQGKNHLTFKLEAQAEEVVLYDADGLQVDLYRWTHAAADVSFARVPDGTGKFDRCATPTCGEDNSSSCGD